MQLTLKEKKIKTDADTHLANSQNKPAFSEHERIK